MVKSYYSARQAASRPIKAHESALFRAGDAGVYALFGGQGNIEEYFNELREISSVYGGLVDDYLVYCARLLSSLSRDPRAGKVYSKGLDVMRWLQDEESTPDLTYLVSAPVSFPLIGLVQLAHYYVTCKILAKEPGELPKGLVGTTGHSQGIVTTAAIASASTWDSFHRITSILSPSFSGSVAVPSKPIPALD